MWFLYFYGDDTVSVLDNKVDLVVVFAALVKDGLPVAVNYFVS